MVCLDLKNNSTKTLSFNLFVPVSISNELVQLRPWDKVVEDKGFNIDYYEISDLYKIKFFYEPRIYLLPWFEGF